ncbi:Na+/H+ antiporter NhaD or related arsenite permease [Halanaeroarchaeum sp. HSR-CO]|uniref:SLC13 family permease n=1 Tax=Halanaeroarchaeum sp. HSR-CO TaxID=2866382 RepID=UPI00217D808E|nr:DASS family sodium-coupled anion symporter [Halanaeroarchaeum sp. HSR-CO]UWG48879.1 Na+/H+ antiporter NhaD or related arsenite permease [Halanaeroarchaeum sp. HSR-CO]
MTDGEPLHERITRQHLGLVLGPTTFGTVALLSPFGMSPVANATFASTLWIAIWWVTEAIPIPATSLLPVVLFPLTGVVDVAGATAPYADPIVFLLLGGFLLALAIERWHLHRRIALTIVGVVGVQTDRLLLGFMVSTAFLSMWISNSATAMLMVPIGMAVIAEFGVPTATERETPVSTPAGDGPPIDVVHDVGIDPDDLPETRFGLALMLGIAYSASIGGVATIIGSPPNAVFAGVVQSRFGLEITFLDWMLFATPLSVGFLLVTWYLLLWLFRPPSRAADTTEAIIETQREVLGDVSRGERRVLVVFVLVAAAWVLRPFVLQPLFPSVTDTVIALAGGVLLFAIPADLREGEFLLHWDDAKRLPWGVLVLLGGGFSLANAFQESGLDEVIARSFTALGGLPLVAILLVVATVVVFLTEVTSNTATATVFMPIMASLGATLGVSPITLMGAAALAASLAFMLPVATPPNAVVFGSGYVSVPQMARAGLLLNLLGIGALVALTYLWLPIALGLVG